MSKEAGLPSDDRLTLLALPSASDTSKGLAGGFETKERSN
jgi:hypothetical protein